MTICNGFSIKNGDFHSYVSLPEGKVDEFLNAWKIYQPVARRWSTNISYMEHIILGVLMDS